jgi:hypothetical protein
VERRKWKGMKDSVEESGHQKVGESIALLMAEHQHKH